MDIKNYIIDQLDRYWKKNTYLISSLPIPRVPLSNSKRYVLKEVALPSWGREYGVCGCFLVPDWSIVKSENENDWERTDWYSVIFWLLACIPERNFEEENGPIHSYSYRLKNWDSRLWDYAWVNRIALFLRRWASVIAKKSEEEIFGLLPKPKIWITHDLDAVKKTLPIRIKQSIFQFYNGYKQLKSKSPSKALQRFKKGIMFLFSNNKYLFFDEICSLEKRYGLDSIFMVYGGAFKKRKTFKQWLIDPNYNLQNKTIKDELSKLQKKGFRIGLHQSYCSWNNEVLMKNEKDFLHIGLNQDVVYCRQHWLRFSWDDTWEVQGKIGLMVDMTLGFNDRPGFRNSSALEIHPYSIKKDKKMLIKSIPMVLMDSHLYDYQEIDEKEREREIKRIIEEIYFVKGEGSVIWHPHVFSKDYGWYEGFNNLLKVINQFDKK